MHPVPGRLHFGRDSFVYLFPKLPTRTFAVLVSVLSTKDRPGKFGWVGHVGGNESGAFNTLTVPMRFSTMLPRLRVTYLETYRDAGRARVAVAAPGADPWTSLPECAFVDAYRGDTKYSQVLGLKLKENGRIDCAFEG